MGQTYGPLESWLLARQDCHCRCQSDHLWDISSTRWTTRIRLRRGFLVCCMSPFTIQYRSSLIKDPGGIDLRSRDHLARTPHSLFLGLQQARKRYNSREEIRSKVYALNHNLHVNHRPPSSGVFTTRTLVLHRRDLLFDPNGIYYRLW